ncbi:MAG: hypothetical protein JSV56_02090, partial [Methanomassiliicoccales archaeon]
SAESGKIELTHGEDYTFYFYLEGSAPNPEPNTNPQPDPVPLSLDYVLDVDYQIKKCYQYPRHLLTGNYHPEEIPPERLPEYSLASFPGNHLDSFMVDEPGLLDFLKGYYFDSYKYAMNTNMNTFQFDIPDGDRWYFVISNRDSIETTKVVELKMDLYKIPQYCVEITNPADGSMWNLGDVITISGIVTNESELLSLELSTDGGNNWIPLTWSDHRWSYDWVTSSLNLGTFEIEVIATFQSTSDTDLIEIEIIDTEPPSLSILTPPDNSQHNVGSIITISGTASDNVEVTSLQLSTDGGNSWINILSALNGGQWSYDWITSGLSPDFHEIVVRGSDGTNEASSTITVELIDSDPPSISILYPQEDDRIYEGTTLAITGNATDNVGISSLQISTDGGDNWTDILSSLYNGQWYYNWITTGLYPGNYVIEINASDGTYYESIIRNVEMMDSKSPSVSISHPFEDEEINIGEVITINGTATDNVDIVSLRLSTDGGLQWIDVLSSLDNSTWSYEWNTAGLSVGQRSIIINASDGVYNETFSCDIELVDIQGPSVSITSFEENAQFNLGTIITIRGTANDNVGIQELKLKTSAGKIWVDILPSLNGDKWSYVWDTSGCSVGKCTIQIKASDGIFQETDSVRIELVDTISPDVAITFPAQDSGFNIGSTIMVSGTASDDNKITELKLSTDGGITWEDILSSLSDGKWLYYWDTQELLHGQYGITVEASDGINIPEYSTVEINLIDAEVPVLEITTPDIENQFDAGDIVQIKGQAFDDVGVSSISISMDDGDTWIDISPSLDSRGRWGYIWDTSDMKAGTYSVRVKISDGANEVEETVTVVLIAEKPEEEEEGIDVWMILLLVMMVLVLIIAITGAIIFKKRRRKK